MERNMKLLVDYSEKWPLMTFPGFVLPELLQIFVLSEKLGVVSPIPKLPFINAEKNGSKNIFGWNGSVGFVEGLALRKKVCSKPPSIISEDAVNQVCCELEEAMASSSTLESTIARIENSCITANSGESSCASSSSSSATTISSSEALTSPIPSRKNQSFGAKTRNKDHSNKGSVGSHRLNHSQLQLSVKVIYNWFYSIQLNVCFINTFFHFV